MMKHVPGFSYGGSNLLEPGDNSSLRVFMSVYFIHTKNHISAFLFRYWRVEGAKISFIK